MKGQAMETQSSKDMNTSTHRFPAAILRSDRDAIQAVGKWGAVLSVFNAIPAPLTDPETQWVIVYLRSQKMHRAFHLTMDALFNRDSAETAGQDDDE